VRRSVNDLIKIFGTDKKIYRDYCPMYDQGKVAIGLVNSRRLNIHGSEMLTCGGITQTW
jgi:hypothetical protein